jgi:hypothetical protein
MRQTLHIFRKDVRFLWPFIVVVIVLTGLATWSRAIDPSRLAKGNADASSIRDIITFFQILSWWCLIVSAVFKEPPAGDRQFWVTRPYHWNSLAAAKLLLILAFINAPYLLSEIVIVQANGLSPVLSSLVQRQAQVAALFIIPAAALAAVTRSSIQIALPVAGLWLALVVTGGLRSTHQFTSEAPEWARVWTVSTVLGGASMAVLLWQYAWRRTVRARAVLVGATALCFVLLTVPTPALPIHRPEPAVTRPISLCIGVPPAPAACAAEGPEAMHGWLPILIQGVPEGMNPEPELMAWSVQAADRAGFRSGWRNPTGASSSGFRWNWSWVRSDHGLYRWISVDLDRELVERFRGRPVNVSASVMMTIYAQYATAEVPRDGQWRQVEGVGMCSIERHEALAPPFLRCRTAEPPSVHIELNGVRIGRGWTLYDASPIFEFYSAPPIGVAAGQRACGVSCRTGGGANPAQS